MGDPILVVDALRKRYPASKRAGAPVVALDGVALQVEEGEFVALLGPSGCGKTTLLRCIAGFVDPDGGEIRIGGVSVLGVPPYRRPLNTVFQNYALFPHMSVADNIGYGPRRRGIARAEVETLVEDALAMTGMSGYGARFLSELSGGQQQRVALARAVINRPKLLLLDEPLSALDLKLRKQMRIELKHLQARLGISFLFVTHDQEEAMTMADRIVVMNNGQVEQIGSGEEIYSRPLNRFVAGFVGEANLIECRVEPDGRLVSAAFPTGLPQRAGGGMTSATLLVRPEAIQLGEGAPGHSLGFEATIRDRVFAGGGVSLHLVLGNGESLVAQPVGAEAAALAEGDRVRMHFALAALHLLPG